MTIVLDDPSATAERVDNSTQQPSGHDSQPSGGQRLRREMAAVRLSFHWPGTTKTLSPTQKATAANAFGAAGKAIRAGKKLIDTSHPA